MWVTPAFAQDAGVPGGGVPNTATVEPAPTASDGAANFMSSPLGSLLPFVLIFVIMYFLLIRPQRNKMRAHQEMIKAVRRGDTIVTSGGLIGKIAKVVDEAEIELEIAEKTRVRVARSAIAEVRAKGEPVKEEA